MKKRHGFFIGFVVLLLAAIFTFTGCSHEDDGGGGGGGSIPSELVGSWGMTDPDDQYIKINANGTGTYGNVGSGQACTWSVSGTRLTITLSGQTGSATWSVSDSQLTISSPTGALAGLLTPLTVLPLDKLD
jgi:hypothetical protein